MRKLIVTFILLLVTSPAYAIDVFLFNTCMFKPEQCLWKTEQTSAIEELDLLSEALGSNHKLTYFDADCGLQLFRQRKKRLLAAEACASIAGGFNRNRRTLHIVPPWVSEPMSIYGYFVIGRQAYVSFMPGCTANNRRWLRLALRELGKSK